MRILGVDISSTAIRAVEIDSAFGRFEIHEYHERRLSMPNPGDAAVSEALVELFQSLKKKPDKIVTSLKTRHTTFRNLDVPTRDKKAIQAAIGFELEDELPLSVEQMILDSVVLAQSRNSSQVHVASTIAEPLQKAIALWGPTGTEPDFITTEAWAYRGVLQRTIPSAQPGATGFVVSGSAPRAIVNIGHDRTTVIVFHHGQLVLARDVPWGGSDITLAVSQAYDFPLPEAESLKIDRAVLLSEEEKAAANAETIEFSDLIAQALHPLVSELRQLDLTCKNITHKNLGSISLTGGSSVIRGLTGYLSAQLNITAEFFRPMSLATSSLGHGVDYSDATEANCGFAAALALSVLGPEKGKMIQFRKGIFSKRDASRKLDLRALKSPMLAFGAVILSLWMSLVIEKGQYQAQIEDTSSQLEKSVKVFFPTASPSAVRSYLSNPANLSKQIKKEVDTQRELAELFAPNPKSPTDFLREISVAIPKDAVVDLVRYQVGAAPWTPKSEAIVALTFLVANPQMAEKLINGITSKIAGLQRSKLEEVPSVAGEPKKWKITISGKPTEDAYGRP